MFNFPIESFWFIVPWPFIWLALGFIMYFWKKEMMSWKKNYIADQRKR